MDTVSIKKLWVKKILSLSISALLTALVADAIPAHKRPAMYTTADGLQVTLTPCGDETFHYLIDDEGQRYFLENDLAVKVSKSEYLDRYESTAPLRVKRRSWSNPTYPRTGSPRVPVILVQFADRAFSFGAQDFERMMNQQGYSDYGAGGSAADYFADNSCGIFTPQFDVYGPVTLSGNVADYGTNDAYGNDANAHLMVVEACRLLDSEIDFSNYDEDGDGMADIVYLYYAGYGENDGGSSTTVWPHTSSLSAKGTALTLDGTSINSYSCSNELQNGYGRTLTGIGTFCHEYTHVLGFPDLYATVSTDDRDFWTPDAWTLMDQGSYNNNSRTPAGYTAYERESMGWLNPITATGDALTLLPAIQANRALKVTTSTNENEYFLIEYRTRRGWDAYLPGEGILVWHIDYDANVWNANTVNNNPDHLRVHLVPADGLQADNERPGIAFKAGSNITLPTWIGNANARLSVSSKIDNYMAVSVNNGATQLPTPTEITATHVRDTKAAFSWDAVDGASGYNVTVTDANARYVACLTNVPTDKPEITITGLSPLTTYNIAVAATAGASMGADSKAVEFTTGEPGLSFVTPDTPALTALSHNSLEISWAAVVGAERYLINVWHVIDGEETGETCAFDDGLSLPAGWFTTCSSTFAVASYCGQSKPSLVMEQNSVYLQSPKYNDDILTLSFYCRGRNTDSNVKLNIEGLIDNSWKTIDYITVSTSAQTPRLTLPAGVKSIKITLVNTTGKGTVMIDDIALGFGLAKVKDYAVKDHEIVGETSHTLTNLAPATTYYATIKAADSYDVSYESATAMASTPLDPSGTQEITHSDMIHIDGSTVTVNAPGSTITICNISGLVVASAHNVLKVQLDAKGIYIVHTGSQTVKIAIK